MTNRFPGPCTACTQRVEVGQGEYTPATKALRHTQCSAPITPPRPFSIDRCRSLGLFEAEVNAQTDLLELNRIRNIINSMNRASQQHPLNHSLRGYGPAYGVLNKRAEALGFKPYSGGYYKPHNP